VTDAALLGEDEAPPCATARLDGRSCCLIVCDHAGSLLPRALGTLGLSPVELRSHIAWDIGAAGVAGKLSDAIDGALITQRYSRLVIDCNRPPGSSTSIVAESELTPVPGNRQVGAAEAEARAQAIFWPYHRRIGDALDARARDGRATILVAIHSFTPVYKGVSRPWHAGILYNRDARLARFMLDRLRREEGLAIGENEPYAVSDESDYTIPIHGEKRGLPHVELEIRQDLLATDAGQAEWAARLAPLLAGAAELLAQTR
jgi:predicted N-formylglutamate amidohydrolase